MTTKLTNAFLVTFAGAVLLAPFYIPLFLIPAVSIIT